jgi:hypothetical protein
MSLDYYLRVQPLKKGGLYGNWKKSARKIPNVFIHNPSANIMPE